MTDIGMDCGSGERFDSRSVRHVEFDDVGIAYHGQDGQFRITIYNGEYARVSFKNIDEFSAFIRACQWVRAKVDAPL